MKRITTKRATWWCPAENVSQAIVMARMAALEEDWLIVGLSSAEFAPKDEDPAWKVTLILRPRVG